MHDLYVLGGAQRSSFKDAQQDWTLFERALIARVGPQAPGEICFAYQTPLAARASAQSSVLFKSGAIVGNRLYACTSTEVMVFEVPGFRCLHYVSLPFFNDVHHVWPTPRGTLAVAVTGLDLVAELGPEGELVAAWSAVGGNPWERFDRAADYRQVPTLKPYRAHVNFSFWAQGELWASRGDRGDAVCLADPQRTIALGTRECIHDGWVRDGFIYFTSVDGHLYVVNERTLRVEEQFDLHALQEGEAVRGGWCRGVLPLAGNRAWIGFTRFRPTRWKEKLRWAKGMVQAVGQPTRLVLYDLAQRRQLDEIPLEPLGMHAVFNAVPVPAAAS